MYITEMYKEIWMGIARVDYNLPICLCSCNILCKYVECMIKHKYAHYLYKTLDSIAVQAHIYVNV